MALINVQKTLLRRAFYNEGREGKRLFGLRLRAYLHNPFFFTLANPCFIMLDYLSCEKMILAGEGSKVFISHLFLSNEHLYKP